MFSKNYTQKNFLNETGFLTFFQQKVFFLEIHLGVAVVALGGQPQIFPSHKNLITKNELYVSMI